IKQIYLHGGVVECLRNDYAENRTESSFIGSIKIISYAVKNIFIIFGKSKADDKRLEYNSSFLQHERYGTGVAITFFNSIGDENNNIARRVLRKIFATGIKGIGNRSSAAGFYFR